MLGKLHPDFSVVYYKGNKMKIYKLRVYLFNLFFVLLLCTGVSNAGQLMVCKLYTGTGDATVYADTVGWFVYKTKGALKPIPMRFPEHREMDIHNEEDAFPIPHGFILLESYIKKIVFHSDDENRKLQATLELVQNPNKWSYKASGSYNGKPLASRVTCSEAIYFADPLDNEDRKTYSYKFLKAQEVANYSMEGSELHDGGDQEVIKKPEQAAETKLPTPVELARDRTNSNTTATEYGACAAYVQYKDTKNYPANNAWPLNISWRYSLVKGATLKQDMHTMSTCINGRANTHESINNQINFSTNGSRDNPQVTKIVGEFRVHDGNIKWSILRNTDNTFRIEFRDKNIFNVVQGSINCVTDSKPLTQLPQPKIPMTGRTSHSYIYVTPPIEEQQKDGTCCGDNCVLS
ncbi:MAG: hypothetical protein K0R14_2132 [Burkholderiales bacterium]|jgi:hypothetical protein|nr:hypothetical protein [Burkholderiales bacterium]